ncbi:hypothetical protein BDV12DRAFT_7624 [Aspergillus spectabilis]
MAQRTNPPRRVRRKLAYGPFTTRYTINGSSNNDANLSHKSPSQKRQTPAPNSQVPKKLLLCLDYGTASTSLSYMTFNPRRPPTDVHPGTIRSVINWPQASGHFDGDSAYVPSESWYRDGKYLWGFQVQQTLQTLSEDDDASSINCVVQLPKLLLDNDDEEDEEEEEQAEDDDDDTLLQPRQALRNVGKTAREAIQDYLIKVFKHAHEQLATREGFNDNWEVELGLCVPSKWSTYAQLTMQEILLDVLDKTDMRGQEFSMFIIDEPEAAVTFALAHDVIRKRIEKGTSFIVCDAGGGTVDAITYKVRQDDPFRFDEVVTPAGNDCGSSYINQALMEESRRRLEHLTDLGRGPVYSKEGVIQEDLFSCFEHKVKRTYDPAKLEDGEPIRLRVYGLQPDPARNFGHGIFFITKEQMNSYFERSLQGSVDLIEQQLDEAAGENVKVLLLVGGFSKSPALRRRMDEAFWANGKKRLKVLYLTTDIDMTTAVSRGAVLRALNKENGPRRKLRLNLGVRVTEPWNPKFTGHNYYFKHPLNRKRYVENCLDWVIRKDREIGDNEVTEIRLHRVFEPGKEWEASETIYFSDQRVYQHYRQDDPMNRGHRKAGVVEASLEMIRESNRVEMKVNDRGDTYYEVHYSIRLEVNGRNVKATIHCPPGREVQGETQICIAAAFKPGTK